MPAFITFGRVLFAVLFVYSGATKLFGIQATTEFVAAKIAIPAFLLPYTSTSGRYFCPNAISLQVRLSLDCQFLWIGYSRFTPPRTRHIGISANFDRSKQSVGPSG